jgi:CHAT domain-containing protein
VIVTTAKLDDAASVELFSSLHRRIASGVSPAAALREVQLEALASGHDDLRLPITWASIQISGAV